MQAQAEGLEIRIDHRFQERLWTVQRAAWVGMMLFTAAALFGATGGGGALAMGRVAADGAAIEYPRIGRWQRSEQISITLPPSAGSESRILLDAGLLDAYSVSSVTPAPKSARATPGGVQLVVERTPGAAGTVSLSVRPERPMPPRAMQVRVDGTPLNFTAVVLP